MVNTHKFQYNNIIEFCRKCFKIFSIGFIFNIGQYIYKEFMMCFGSNYWQISQDFISSRNKSAFGGERLTILKSSHWAFIVIVRPASAWISVCVVRMLLLNMMRHFSVKCLGWQHLACNTVARVPGV